MEMLVKIVRVGFPYSMICLIIYFVGGIVYELILDEQLPQGYKFLILPFAIVLFLALPVIIRGMYLEFKEEIEKLNSDEYQEKP